MLPSVDGRRRVVALLVGALALAGCAAPGSPDTRAGSAAAAPTDTTEAAGLAPEVPTTDLPTVAVVQLPAEGVRTLELIRDGGPYPYSKDGATFSNREQLLPAQPRGFYAEYTVVTPGSDDRGARRIVAGDDGSRFYTSDHYASFREVVSR